MKYDFCEVWLLLLAQRNSLLPDAVPATTNDLRGYQQEYEARLDGRKCIALTAEPQKCCAVKICND